jgi:Myb-like DNA-binding domain
MFTTAEYQEWPMHGFFKRTLIGDEIRYGMEFSLEQLHELCALACPHASRAVSSIRSVGSPRPPTRARKTGSGPPPKIKGTRFTQEEDAKLIDMKETKRRSWDEIEGAFPGRTRAALQVHYSTKLKNRASLLRRRQRASK